MLLWISRKLSLNDYYGLWIFVFLQDIGVEDGGMYKVNAKNELGESNANINLNLEPYVLYLIFNHFDKLRPPLNFVLLFYDIYGRHVSLCSILGSKSFMFIFVRITMF